MDLRKTLLISFTLILSIAVAGVVGSNNADKETIGTKECQYKDAAKCDKSSATCSKTGDKASAHAKKCSKTGETISAGSGTCNKIADAKECASKASAKNCDKSKKSCNKSSI